MHWKIVLTAERNQYGINMVNANGALFILPMSFKTADSKFHKKKSES